MLKEIKIKNLAIVDDLQIQFCSSFNVVTGRSGSGKTIIYKSIIMDSRLIIKFTFYYIIFFK